MSSAEEKQHIVTTTSTESVNVKIEPADDSGMSTHINRK